MRKPFILVIILIITFSLLLACGNPSQPVLTEPASEMITETDVSTEPATGSVSESVSETEPTSESSVSIETKETIEVVTQSESISETAASTPEYTGQKKSDINILDQSGFAIDGEYIDYRSSQIFYFEYGSEHTVRVTLAGEYAEDATYHLIFEDWNGETIAESFVDTITIKVDQPGTIRCWLYSPYYVDSSPDPANPLNEGSTKSLFVRVENHLNAWAVNDDKRRIPLNDDGSAVLSVEAYADDMEDIQYTWYDYSDNDSDKFELLGYGSVFKIEGIKKGPISTDKQPMCFVTDKYMNRYGVGFELYWENHFEMVAAGTDLTKVNYSINKGSTAELSVDISADDTSQMSISWYFNYRDYFYDTQGQTSITVHRPGIYRCLAVDKFGNKQDVYYYIDVVK